LNYISSIQHSRKWLVEKRLLMWRWNNIENNLTSVRTHVCALVTKMVHVVCGPRFFKHSQATWPGSPQYKQRLFVCRRYFSCSVKGLNLVLSICMGLYFGEVAEGWANIVSGKFLCVASGAKFIYVVNVGSWCPSCRHLKSLLSHQRICAITWLHVEGFRKVSNKSFTSPLNPN
jgi:hypothetical protein